ncbi:DUF4238 domain-containing protein [Kitasatospora cineracea]|uniref:DUF4238 domain-containing protein n=1 Tax=Kitasatospora cineracea TaxID=88074 RepID=UPI00340035FA
MTEYPKKHHFVPQFLLRRFADAGNRLVVHRIADERQFATKVTDIGHRNLGHSIYRPGREPDHHSMEAWMAQLEGDAATAIEELAKRRDRSVPDEARIALAWLMALQWQRSQFLKHLIGNEMGKSTSEVDGQLFQTVLMSALNAYVLSPWSLRDEEHCRPKDQWNFLVSVLLSGAMHWSCYRPRAGGLIVGDNVPCFSGYADTPPPGIPPAWLDHGVGVGPAEFRRVTFPLGTDMVVIISRDPRDAARLSASDINRFTVFNSREFVAHSPSWPTDHPRLAADLRDHLGTQRLVSPVFLQDYAPGGRAARKG